MMSPMTSLRRAAALVVHDNGRHARLGGDARESVVAAEAPDVVEHVRAGIDGCARHFGLVGVDADRRVGQCRADRFDRGHDAPDLLFGRDLVEAGVGLVRARPRRLAADVEDVGAFVDEPARLLDGCVDCR